VKPLKTLLLPKNFAGTKLKVIQRSFYFYLSINQKIYIAGLSGIVNDNRNLSGKRQSQL
jgi:hypothetical protein